MRRPSVLVVPLLLVAAVIPAATFAAGARLFKSGPIQITADGSTVWVANPDHDSVTRISTATDVATEFPLPSPGVKDKPLGVSVKEDGSEVWVACHDSDRVYVLAGATGVVVATIDFPWGSGPYSVALSRDQRRAIVTLHRAEAIAVVDVPSRTITDMLAPAYRSGMGIAWMEDGVNAWVTHILADGEHPFITRINFSGPRPKLVTQIRVNPAQPQNDIGDGQGIRPAEGGYLTHRGHVAQIPRAASGRNELWIPTQYNNIHNDSWSPDSTVQSTIRHLLLGNRTLPGLNTDKVIFTAVEVHDPNITNPGSHLGPGWDAHVAGPVDIAFSADASMGYIVHELSNDVLVFPTSTPAIKPAGPSLVEIAVGNRPMGIAQSPVTNLAYVSNLLSEDVSVLDLGATPPVELRRIPVSVGPSPIPATILRGAKLFHTSADPRISVNDKVSCASCHLNAEHDGRPWSFEKLPGNHGLRSVQSLLGLNLTFGPPDPASGYGQLHLSGDRDELQDFEHTFQGVNFGGTGFIGAGVCTELSTTCANAGKDPDLDAIAAYVLSLPALARSPHRDPLTGSLTEEAIRGYTYFMGADPLKVADSACATCHVAPTNLGDPAIFADRQFHDIGYRPGREAELNVRPAPWTWAMNTQALVGVWSTPPWDGAAVFPESSMIELFKDMAGRATSATPHGSPDGLTGRQLRDLDEFVKSIDGNMTGAEISGLADRLPPRIVRVEPASLSRLDVWFSETVDPATAADPANYVLTQVGVGPITITGATWDPQNGDRVTLTAPMADCFDYLLTPVGSIYDAADWATGGVANPVNVSDATNTHGFAINGQLTVTMGATGYENLTIPVHDAAMISPGLGTWSHDSIWLSPGNVGFVRFDWEGTFATTTGVTAATDISAASFSLASDFGDVQTIEVRRTLLAWSDPATGNDWNQNPGGGPTWNSHAHPSGAWNTRGARALGGTGKAVTDYNGVWDRAAAVDLTLVPQAVNERVDFAGPEILDAFQFWFANRAASPAVDYGHSFELKGGNQELRYQRWEHEVQQSSPVLTITYQLPVVTPGDVSGRGASEPLLMAKGAAGDLLMSFEDLAPEATMYNVYEGTIGSWYSHSGAACGLTAALSGVRRETLHTPAVGDRYFIATGSNCRIEGPSDLDHPPALLDCPN